jgi:general secretion pathway protein C
LVDKGSVLKLKFNIKIDTERWFNVIRPLGICALLGGIAYFLASTVSAISMSLLVKRLMVPLAGQMRKPVVTASLTNFSGTNPNFHSLQKVIKDRNLFNAAGNFPEESVGAVSSDESGVSSFDIKAPCKKTTLNISLVGTIMIAENLSLATVKEQSFDEPDIYREGDGIIGNESAVVVKIERNRVIINHNGVKECLELEAVNPKFITASKDQSPVVIGTGNNKPPTGAEPPTGGGDVILKEKYVQDELGPGFATIIQKARFVPNTVDSQMNGFKIFAIEPQSLFARAGLQNGDIITQVNETSLKQPDQGFALYQAFNDEREVRIHILRGGTTPMMITVRIN